MRSENPLNFGDVSKRMFNGGICEFESYNPSQAVRSLGCPVRVVCATFPRLTETVAGLCGGFFLFQGGVGEISALVSGREFPISVFLSQRLSSTRQRLVWLKAAAVKSKQARW